MEESLALQRLVVQTLRQSPALAAAGVAVHDGPPADAKPPFVALGPDSFVSWSWKGGGGIEHRLVLTAWVGRDGLASAKALVADVVKAVLAMPRHEAGLKIVTLRFVRGLVKRDPRRWTEGRMEFLARTVREDD